MSIIRAPYSRALPLRTASILFALEPLEVFKDKQKNERKSNMGFAGSTLHPPKKKIVR